MSVNVQGISESFKGGIFHPGPIPPPCGDRGCCWVWFPADHGWRMKTANGLCDHAEPDTDGSRHVLAAVPAALVKPQPRSDGRLQRDAIVRELKHDASRLNHVIGRLVGVNANTVGNWRTALLKAEDIHRYDAAGCKTDTAPHSPDCWCQEGDAE